jgi:hypothetical protein
MLEPPNVAGRPELKSAKYRPGEIRISHPSPTHWIALSWADGKPHNDSLQVNFLRQVTP